MKYCYLDSPAVNQKVGQLIEETAREIETLICPRSIVLKGSFAFGEGMVRHQGRQLRFWSDFDFVVITSQLVIHDAKKRLVGNAFINRLPVHFKFVNETLLSLGVIQKFEGIFLAGQDITTLWHLDFNRNELQFGQMVANTINTFPTAIHQRDPLLLKFLIPISTYLFCPQEDCPFGYLRNLELLTEKSIYEETVLNSLWKIVQLRKGESCTLVDGDFVNYHRVLMVCLRHLWQHLKGSRPDDAPALLKRSGILLKISLEDLLLQKRPIFFRDLLLNLVHTRTMVNSLSERPPAAFSAQLARLLAKVPRPTRALNVRKEISAVKNFGPQRVSVNLNEET